MRQESLLNLRRKGILDLAAQLKERNVFPGFLETRAEGWGFDVSDIRGFESGDDPRDIDIEGLPRGEMDVLEHQSLQENPMMLFVDVSSSMLEYPYYPQYSKAFLRNVSAGMILFSALKTMIPAGMVMVSDSIEKYLPPAAGEYVNRLFEALLLFGESSNTSLSLVELARYAQQFQDSRICIVSDFQDEKIRDGDWSWMSFISGMDIIPVVVRDLIENFSPDGGIYFLCQDPGSGRESPVYLSGKKYRALQKESRRFYEELYNRFARLRISYIELALPEVASPGISEAIDECHRRLQRFFAKKFVEAKIRESQ